MPGGATFSGTTSDTLTLHGAEVVVTLGRIGVGSQQAVQVPATIASSLSGGTMLKASAVLRSSTALPVSSNQAPTLISH